MLFVEWWCGWGGGVGGCAIWFAVLLLWGCGRKRKSKPQEASRDAASKGWWSGRGAPQARRGGGKGGRARPARQAAAASEGASAKRWPRSDVAAA